MAARLYRVFHEERHAANIEEVKMQQRTYSTDESKRMSEGTLKRLFSETSNQPPRPEVRFRHLADVNLWHLQELAGPASVRTETGPAPYVVTFEDTFEDSDKSPRK